MHEREGKNVCAPFLFHPNENGEVMNRIKTHRRQHIFTTHNNQMVFRIFRFTQTHFHWILFIAFNRSFHRHARKLHIRSLSLFAFLLLHTLYFSFSSSFGSFALHIVFDSVVSIGFVSACLKQTNDTKKNLFWFGPFALNKACFQHKHKMLPRSIS